MNTKFTIKIKTKNNRPENLELFTKREQKKIHKEKRKHAEKLGDEELIKCYDKEIEKFEKEKSRKKRSWKNNFFIKLPSLPLSNKISFKSALLIKSKTGHFT